MDNFQLFRKKTFILRIYDMREAVGKTLLNLIKLKITKFEIKRIQKNDELEYNSAKLLFDSLFDFFI